MWVFAYILLFWHWAWLNLDWIEAELCHIYTARPRSPEFLPRLIEVFLFFSYYLCSTPQKL